MDDGTCSWMLCQDGQKGAIKDRDQAVPGRLEVVEYVARYRTPCMELHTAEGFIYSGYKKDGR